MRKSQTIWQNPKVTDTAARMGAPALPDHERRQEPRFAATGPCYLVLFDGANEARAAGSIQDISAHGVRIRTRAKAIPGTKIQAVLQDREVVYGSVRHCTANADGTYDIGILIESTSSEKAKPENGAGAAAPNGQPPSR